MQLIVEASVPFVQGIAESYAEVVYLDNKDITAQAVKDADALLVRSITKCDRSLLGGSKVRYIATATAGADHIDADYCTRAGIQWSNAPGCNAMSVAQYVLCSLAYLSLRDHIALENCTMGIIGVGHVGRLVDQCARALGMKTLLYDPPRAEQEVEHASLFCSMEELLAACDILSLHVPLTHTGPHATQGMITEELLSRSTKRPILINACRGNVTTNEALIASREQDHIAHLILDCWPGEPHIHKKLLTLADIASPHIAGFSADGKHRGARMALLSISQFFDWGLSPDILKPLELENPSEPIDISVYPEHEAVARALLHTLDPWHISTALKHDPNAFEALRKSYVYPREMAAYQIRGGSEQVRGKLARLGFQICTPTGYN